jgi:hypothetical protein
MIGGDGSFLGVYRMDGEIAVPCVLQGVTMPYDPVNSPNAWFKAKGATRTGRWVWFDDNGDGGMQQVHILPNSRYPARTHSHSLIAYRMFQGEFVWLGQGGWSDIAHVDEGGTIWRRVDGNGGSYLMQYLLRPTLWNINM